MSIYKITVKDDSLGHNSFSIFKNVGNVMAAINIGKSLGLEVYPDGENIITVEEQPEA